MFIANKVFFKTSLMGLLALSFLGLSSPAFAEGVDHESIMDKSEKDLSPAEKEKKKDMEKAVLGHGATTVDNAAKKITDGKPIVINSKKSAVVDTRFADKSLYPVDDTKIGSDLKTYLNKVKGDQFRSAKLSDIELAVRSHPTITGKIAQAFMVASSHFIAELSPTQVGDLDATKLVTAMSVYVKSTAGANDIHILDHAADFARDHQTAPIKEVVKGGIQAFTGNTAMDAKEKEDLANCALGA